MTLKVVDYFGDVNPIEYGGGVVVDRTGRDAQYGPFIEYVHGLDNGDTTRRMKVYRIDVAHAAELRHENWVKWREIVKFADIDVRELDKLKNTLPLQYAIVILEAVTGYYGWHELDQYPLELTAAEVAERWGLDFDGDGDGDDE